MRKASLGRTAIISLQLLQLGVLHLFGQNLNLLEALCWRVRFSPRSPRRKVSGNDHSSAAWQTEQSCPETALFWISARDCFIPILVPPLALPVPFALKPTTGALCLSLPWLFHGEDYFPDSSDVFIKDEAVVQTLQRCVASVGTGCAMRLGGSSKGKHPNPSRDFEAVYTRLLNDYFGCDPRC